MSFTATRPGTKENFVSLNPYLQPQQQNTLEQHVNEDIYYSNIPTPEVNSVLSLEDLSIFNNDYWNYSMHHSEKYNQQKDMDCNYFFYYSYSLANTNLYIIKAFLSYHGLLEKNIYTGRNVTPSYKMYPSYTKLDTNNTSKTNNHQLVTDHSSYYQAKYMTKDKMIIPSKGQLSWQQSIFLQKKPEQPIAITYSQNQYTPSVQSTPISAIVSKEAIEEVNRQTKKRYMTREQDPISPIASSMSEPIRTNIDHPPVPRKRTKSLQYDRSMTSSPFSSSDGSSNDNNDHHQLVEPANYVTLSNALDSFSDSFYDGVQSHQMLLAMPRRQKLRYEGDHYTPKWVRYTGHLKEGYCDICPSGKWLQLKNSAYWYIQKYTI